MLNQRSNSTDPTLIAPCGLDCRLCRAYDREKNPCPGCRTDGLSKSKSCLHCKIKNCERLAEGGYDFCFDCDEFPCMLIVRLDKRYRLRYVTSAIENLAYIQEHGVTSFVVLENRRWACPQCGDMLCMHKAQCPSCGYAWRQV